MAGGGSRNAGRCWVAVATGFSLAHRVCWGALRGVVLGLAGGLDGVHSLVGGVAGVADCCGGADGCVPAGVVAVGFGWCSAVEGWSGWRRG